MDPLLGQIGLIPGASNWITYGICKITGSHCGHAIVYVGNGQVVSADGDWGVGRVRLRPATDFPNVILSKFQHTEEQATAVAAYALAQVGKPYAYLDDALIAVERLGRFRFPEFIRARFAYDGQFQCAQLADFSLHAAGIEFFDDGRMLGDVFPGSFEEQYIEDKWYTADFFKSFPVRWSAEVRRNSAGVSEQGPHTL